MFRGKMAPGNKRVQGVLSPAAAKALETQRDLLAATWALVMGEEFGEVTDSDLLEFLALGRAEAVRKFRELKRETTV